jgi:hypothetical protein
MSTQLCKLPQNLRFTRYTCLSSAVVTVGKLDNIEVSIDRLRCDQYLMEECNLVNELQRCHSGCFLIQ